MQLLKECVLPCQPLCTRCAAETHPSASTPLTGAMHPLQGTRPATSFSNLFNYSKSLNVEHLTSLSCCMPGTFVRGQSCQNVSLDPFKAGTLCQYSPIDASALCPKHSHWQAISSMRLTSCRQCEQTLLLTRWQSDIRVYASDMPVSKRRPAHGFRLGQAAAASQ